MSTESEDKEAAGSPVGVETLIEPGIADTLTGDCTALVQQMIADGDLPRPELLQQILDFGEAAVGPLLEILKTRPRGWPAEAPLCHAAGLLRMLQPASALLPLCAAARFYKGETVQSLADAIACFGPAGLDALLNLVREPAVSGFQRSHLIHAAKRAAGNDPGQRARVAEVVRELFARVVGEIHADKEFENELVGTGVTDDSGDAPVDVDPSGEPIEEFEEDQFDALLEEDGEGGSLSFGIDSVASEDPDELAHEADRDNEITRGEDLGFLAIDLATLADPLARDMIETAFDAGQIDESIVSRQALESDYRSGGEAFSSPGPWLEEYVEYYDLRLTAEEESRSRSQQTELPRFTIDSPRETTPREPPPRVDPVEPIRNSAPRIGRNDPCWCGSGKKFKKCHMGKQASD
jgi:hypothetical protein